MFGLAVLSGEALPEEDLRAFAGQAAILMAGDGGAKHLWKYGLVPEAIVGDLDSSTLDEFPEVPRIHVPDQNHSDADKVLAVLGEKVPKIMLACIHGGRVDHLLASFHSALAARSAVRWVLPNEYGALVRAGETVRPELPQGTRCSLIPLLGSRVTLAGVAWPLENAPLQLGSAISLSNHITGELTLEVHEGAVWLSVERHAGEVFSW